MSYMVPTLKHIASDSKEIKDTTINKRYKNNILLTECLAVDAHERLIQELQEAKGFSIPCDKASDISMNKIFCINVRYLYNGSPRTKLYQLIRLKRGNAEALFAVLEEALVKDKLTWQQVVGYASDGENLMQEVFEDQSATAERVLNGLKAPYLRATFEFMNFVLDQCFPNFFPITPPWTIY
ncbi:unnamed protein product [Clavelina lepadiformis]|uniref:DUF4371 domain-containing protein n=1 Tax=Clavelina lepadiformis TaxID=159417 RepID=A0ABP0G2Q6_CLALP